MSSDYDAVIDYDILKVPVQRLTGTPHIRGAKFAVGEVREALRDLAVVLEESGWLDEHPIDADRLALDLIDLVDRLGPAERHALRIATAILVRCTARNGYHNNG